MNSDSDWMALALQEARLAAAEGEVPVGAVVVHKGQLIARARNAMVARADPTAHAEMQALRAAAEHLGNYRLNECELYVTLEPCTMCSGAVLNARLSRLVFGASEPKTGAAGSVLNVFEQAALNAHTTLSRGVRATECAALLQDFFAQRRREAKAVQQTQALRDDALRTPEAAFATLPDGPWEGVYTHTLPALKRLRLHYVDEGPQQADRTWLCLHDVSTWGYAFRHLLPLWRAAGHRVLVPDLIGFGRSDKPKRIDVHTWAWHRQVLLEWVTHLDLQRVVLVGQGWGALLGLSLPMAAPERFVGLLALNAWAPEARPAPGQGPGPHATKRPGTTRPTESTAERAAFQAPYPHSAYAAAWRADSRLWPDLLSAEDAQGWQQAVHFWGQQWEGISLVLTDAQADPVLRQQAQQLSAWIRRSPAPRDLPEACLSSPAAGQQLAALALQTWG